MKAVSNKKHEKFFILSTLHQYLSHQVPFTFIDLLDSNNLLKYEVYDENIQNKLTGNFVDPLLFLLYQKPFSKSLTQ